MSVKAKRWRVRLRRAKTQAGSNAIVTLLSLTLLAVLLVPVLVEDIGLRTTSLLLGAVDSIEITEPVIVSEQPRLRVISGTLSVPPAASGQARTGTALATLIKGGSAGLALASPSIDIELSPPSTTYEELRSDRGSVYGLPPSLVTALSPLINALDEAIFESLSIRNGSMDLLSNGTSLARLTNVNVEISVKRKTAIRIKGSASLRGETLVIDATLGARIGHGSSARMPVRAQAKCRLFSVSIDGRLELGQGLQLISSYTDVTIPKLRSVARWLGETWPSGPGLSNFVAHGAVDWSGHTIGFNRTSFELDGNVATGTASLNFDRSRPLISASLAATDLKLATYLGGQEVPDASYDTNSGSSLLPVIKKAQDLSLPLLGSVDADLRVSASAVSLGTWQAGRVAASLRSREDQVTLTLAELVLPELGSAEGDLTILWGGLAPQFHAKGQVSGAEMKGLTTALIGVDLLSGRGNIAFDVTAAGRTGMDLLTRLDGRFDIELPGGAWARCGIAELKAYKDAVATDGCTTVTSLSPFGTGLVATNGVLRAGGVEAQAGGQLMKLSGSVDLVTSVVDVSVSSFTPTLGAISFDENPGDGAGLLDRVVVTGRADDLNIKVSGR